MTGLFLLLLASLAFSASGATYTCPESCRCRGNELKCSPATNGDVKLQKVPPDLLRYNLFHIEEVDLSQNALQQIEPGDFFGLPRAKKLDLRYNRLRALLSNGFSGLHDLRNLDLSHNRVRYIDRFAFEGLQNIRKIDLSHNEITFVEDDSFKMEQGFKFLFTLDLSYNKLHYLNQGTFTGLETLQELYLNHNIIKEIQTAIFTPLQNLERIYISGNDIKCTCDWLRVWDYLQSRDVEIMDTSDALSMCGDEFINCKKTSDQTSLDADSRTLTTANVNSMPFSINDRVSTNLTAEDLRPPETDKHGNIISDDGNSFPLWSPEGEMILSGYDTAIRRLISTVEDGERRRSYSLLFQKRMTDFLKKMKEKGDEYTTLRGTSAENADDSTEYIDEYSPGDYSDDIEPSAAQTAPVNERLAVVRDTLTKDVLKLLFPSAGSIHNLTEFSKTLLDKAKTPQQAWLVKLIFRDQLLGTWNYNRTKQKAPFIPELNIETRSLTTTPVITHTEEPKPLYIEQDLPKSAIVRPEIEIPIFAVIGIFVFVCIAVGAISVFSGYGTAKSDGESPCCCARCCQCKWLLTITEKLSIRKEQMERQRKKANLAKSGFLKMQDQEKTNSLISTSTPEHEMIPTQLVTDDHGVVSVTPLVLTDDFPGKTDNGKSPRDQQKTSFGLLHYIKSKLSPGVDKSKTLELPSISPRDEVTLFEIPTRSSESQTAIVMSVAVNPHETRQSDDVVELAANQEAASPSDIAAGDQSIINPDAKRTSSDLRWYARECLSNQRMMTQGRTQSMTSSEGVVCDPNITGRNEADDGVW